MKSGYITTMCNARDNEIESKLTLQSDGVDALNMMSMENGFFAISSFR